MKMTPSDRKEYFLRTVDGNLSAVSREVYQSYYHARRRERYQEEQKKKRGTISLDAVGYNTGFLSKSGCCQSEIEADIIRRDCIRILYEEIDRLPPWDKRMIGLLYFSEFTVKETAKRLGCSRGKIFSHRRRIFARILKRLRKEGYGVYGSWN